MVALEQAGPSSQLLAGPATRLASVSQDGAPAREKRAREGGAAGGWLEALHLTGHSEGG